MASNGNMHILRDGRELEVIQSFSNDMLAPSLDGLPTGAVGTLHEQQDVRAVGVRKWHPFLRAASVGELRGHGRKLVVLRGPLKVGQLLCLLLLSLLLLLGAPWLKLLLVLLLLLLLEKLLSLRLLSCALR